MVLIFDIEPLMVLRLDVVAYSVLNPPVKHKILIADTFDVLTVELLINELFMTLILRGDDTPVIVLVIVVIPETVDNVIPVPAARFPPILPVIVLALIEDALTAILELIVPLVSVSTRRRPIVPFGESMLVAVNAQTLQILILPVLLLIVFIFPVELLIVDELMIDILRGLTTSPVLVIVVTPDAFVDRAIPAPCARFCERLALIVFEVNVVHEIFVDDILGAVNLVVADMFAALTLFDKISIDCIVPTVVRPDTVRALFTSKSLIVPLLTTKVSQDTLP